MTKIADSVLLNNIGKLLYDMGMYVRAIEFYNRSLAIDKAHKDRHGEALAYNNIGKALYLQKKYKQALSYYQRSLALREDKHRFIFYDYLMHNFGLVYVALHDPQRALPYYEEALAIRRPNANRETIETLMMLAGTYGELGQIDDAVMSYREAATIALGFVPPDRIRANRCFDLGLHLVVQAKRNDLRESLEHDRDSLSISDQ